MKDKVLEIFRLSAEPLKAGEVAEQSGLDKKAVDRAIKELKEEGKLVSPRRCYYSVNK